MNEQIESTLFTKLFVEIINTYTTNKIEIKLFK